MPAFILPDHGPYSAVAIPHGQILPPFFYLLIFVHLGTVRQAQVCL